MADRLPTCTVRRVAIRHLIEKYWRPDIALFVGAMILSAAILVANAITLSDLREETLRSVEANMQSQAIVLAQEGDRSLKVLDLALSIIADHIRHLGVTDSEAFQRRLAGYDIHELLKKKSAGLLHVDAISLVGIDGKLINASRHWPIPDVDVSDRDYFQAMKSDAALKVFISKPVINQATGAWTIYLVRRLNAPNGSFMGLMLGGITVAHFERFFQSIALQQGGAVALARQDGMLLARYPSSDEVGKVIPVVARMSPTKIVNARHVESPIDRQFRILSVRPLAGYPLVVAVSQAEDDALRSWSRFADHSTSMSLVRIFVVLLMALAASRWWQKQRSLTEELRLQNLRFDAALANMGEGLCMFDGEKRLVVCNDRYAKLYQLPPQLLQVGTPHSALIAHRVAQGILKGETDDGAVKEKIAVLGQLPSEATSSRIDELSDGRLICVTRQPTEGGGWVASHQDVSARLLAEKRLEQTRAFLDTVIENIPMPVVVKEPNTMAFVLVNHAYESFLGTSRENIIGKTIDQLLPPESAEHVRKYDKDAVSSGKDMLVAEFEVITPANGVRFVNTTRLVVRNSCGEPEHLISVLEDITDRRQAEQKIRHMAHHDALTDLPNRLLLRERLDDALASTRRGDRGLAVLVLDLDRFKEINDTLGHPVGDALLEAVARRLRSCVRDATTIARLGGDEFAIVEHVTDAAIEATVLAERLQTALSEPFDLGDHQAAVGSSIGIAIAPGDGVDADQLLKNADLALYRAKSDGRGTYRFFEPEMDARMRARRTLERDLRQALANGEFELYYQPFVNLQRNEVCAFEALLRWHHPERGMVSPVEFIPVAEEIGLIMPIGEWVVRTACAEAATWPQHIKVAVNISPVQFRNPNLVQMVFSALAASGLQGRRLELEITESALLQNSAATLATVHQLRAFDVQISMDDFGTGYSSLGYLQTFPFDKIKIDRSFINNLSKGSGALAILKAITTLADSLGVATIAEGVETQEQLEKVRTEGCTEMQGFLFSPALPATEIARLFLASPELAESAA